MSSEIENAPEDLSSNESSLLEFAKHYQSMVSFLNKLPLNAKLKEFCFMNFDQGAMWAKEGILTMDLSKVEKILEESVKE